MIAIMVILVMQASVLSYWFFPEVTIVINQWTWAAVGLTWGSYLMFEVIWRCRYADNKLGHSNVANK